ncbi:hypothetical protein Tco_1450623, partial [Tanacetum coccineum]
MIGTDNNLGLIAHRIPDPPILERYVNAFQSLDDHLSGATWHDNCSGTVTGATTELSINDGQRRSTVADHHEPPPDHHRTTGQRWLTASQRSGLVATWIHVCPRGIHVDADVDN